jgi:RHS repeat-associated protein
VDSLATVDGLGRPHIQQTRQGPGSSNLDSVETDYDSLGRPYRVSMPYTGTAGQLCSPCAWTTTSYDALGRPLTVTDGGGGTVTYTYTQNDILIAVGPAPSGENLKQRQLEYDSIGRLTSVCEITNATGSGSCGQTSAQTGFWTKYSYDAAGRLLTVTQNAQASSGQQQTRSYSYDLAGRLTSETNPESGTTNYVFDSDSTCGNSSGDLVKRTDAVGNVTCYAFDALHRRTSITYPSGSYAASTPSKYSVYDSATVGGQPMANAKGRLAEAYTCTTCPGTKIADLGFSYTVRGQVSDVYESTTHSGSTYYHVNATYWAHGALNTLNLNLSGVPSWTFAVDGEGRSSSVSASSGQNPLTSAAYNLYSAPPNIQATLGSGDSDTFSFDANTGRMTQYKYTVGATPQSVVGALTWNSNGSLASLAITNPFNSADQQTCNYSSDDLARTAGANCGSAAAQTFSYDAFGNLNKSGSPYSFQPTYTANPPTNRIASLPPSFTPTYDANGNVLSDSLDTYTWDVEGRPLSIDTVNLTFDALGRTVEFGNGSSYTQVVYGPTGSKLALMNGQSLVKSFVPLPGGGTAVYASAGLAYYRHPDWLGSSRFASTPSRTMYSSTAYAPFGEYYSQTGTLDLSFLGQNQDVAGGSYDFPDREYSIQGRWPSPDPAGLASASPSNPQSWNRYAFWLQPANFAVPSGAIAATGGTASIGNLSTAQSLGPLGRVPKPPPLFGAAPGSGVPSALALFQMALNPFPFPSVNVIPHAPDYTQPTLDQRLEQLDATLFLPSLSGKDFTIDQQMYTTWYNLPPDPNAKQDILNMFGGAPGTGFGGGGIGDPCQAPWADFWTWFYACRY